MSEKKTYLIINAIPNTDDVESLRTYSSKIMDVFKRHGAGSIQRFITVEQIMGTGGVKTTLVIDFPSAEAIRTMRASDEFNALNDLRKKAFKQDVDLMICENLGR